MKNKVLHIIVILSSIAVMSTQYLLAQRPNHAVLTNAQIWQDYEFMAKGVRGFNSMKDGETFTRLQQNKIVQYQFENFLGKAQTLVDGNALKYNGEAIQIDEYSFNADETKVLIATSFESIYRYSYTAFYFIYDIQTKNIQALDEKRNRQTLAEFSPDGQFVSYLSENNIYVRDLSKNRIRQLTKDGAKNKIINGTTDWVYEEEFAYIKAYEWSPDSKYIAFLKFDESAVKEFTMTFYSDLYPDLFTWKYPKAGEDNSKVTLHVQAINKRSAQQIDLEDYEYIPRINFSPVNNTLLIQTLNRHQNRLRYFSLEVGKKKAKAKNFYKIVDDAYVEIEDNLAFASDGKSFFTSSDKDGYKHLYRIFFNGDIQQITNGTWDVIELLGYDVVNDRLFFTSSEFGATEKDLFVVNVSDKNKTRLSQKAGYTNATFSTGMKYYIQNWSDANTPPVHTLHRANGEQIQLLEDNAALLKKLETYALQPKEFFNMMGAEEVLNCWMIQPKDFDSTKKYPVYIYEYCGPGSNTVLNRWDGNNYMYHQLLAQKGYMVISVDPRGTQFRGAAFMKSTYLQLGKLELEDLIAIANKLKTKEFIDPDRIGIQGWSYGGYMSSLAMTKGDGTFKMGIAVAPVTNWRYYDNIYTERFMRTPQENALGYDDNSPIFFANRLEGNYLIIHGSADDNVHYQNTMEMVNALVKADKTFDMFIYPNRNHGIYGGITRKHIFDKMLKYTLEHL